MAQIEEIERRARELTRVERPRLPRGLWITAAIVAIVCGVGFAIAWLAPNDQAPTPVPGHPTSTRHGLSPFLLVIAAAIVIASLYVRRRRHD